MEEIFNGNVSKETASMIKEMKSSGGSLGVSSFYLWVDFEVVTNRDVSAYLPESTTSAVEKDELTNALGDAFQNMLNDGVEFFAIFIQDDVGVIGVAEIQVIYDEGTTNITGISLDSDILEEPSVWCATDGNGYIANCISLCGNPGNHSFSWHTAGR